MDLLAWKTFHRIVDRNNGDRLGMELENAASALESTTIYLIVSLSMDAISHNQGGGQASEDAMEENIG